MSEDQRLGIVEDLLRDPPHVHAVDRSAVPRQGLWASDPGCYRYLASVAASGMRTLETGAGLSTILLAAIGAQHTAITPEASEVDLIRGYCASHGIDDSAVCYVVESSGVALPALGPDPLDLVLIDGGHGFPTPIVDWYYAGALLRKSGVLVVDDTHLPAVRLLAQFLDADQRWVRHAREANWGSWARVSSGSLDEDWWEQPFFSLPLTVAEVPAKVRARIRRARDGMGRRS